MYVHQRCLHGGSPFDFEVNVSKLQKLETARIGCSRLVPSPGDNLIGIQVLSDPIQRMIYDEIHGYALTAINPFLDDSSPKDHVFVDEFSCIGRVFAGGCIGPGSESSSAVYDIACAYLPRVGA